MAPRSLKPKPVQMRNVMVELPEDRMLLLQRRAKEEQFTVHELVETIVNDWLDR